MEYNYYYNDEVPDKTKTPNSNILIKLGNDLITDPNGIANLFNDYFVHTMDTMRENELLSTNISLNTFDHPSKAMTQHCNYELLLLKINSKTNQKTKFKNNYK